MALEGKSAAQQQGKDAKQKSKEEGTAEVGEKGAAAREKVSSVAKGSQGTIGCQIGVSLFFHKKFSPSFLATHTIIHNL